MSASLLSVLASGGIFALIAFMAAVLALTFSRSPAAVPVSIAIWSSVHEPSHLKTPRGFVRDRLPKFGYAPCSVAR